MFKVLLHLGLIATPLFFIPGQDIRDWKMKAAVAFAMALVAVGLYSTGIKIKNKWLCILLAYLPISIFLAPVPEIQLAGLDVSSFWSWEPLLHILLFTCMAGAIASQNFSYYEVEDILTTMIWVASFSAGYMILQYFMIDQFFMAIESFLPGKGNVAGFIGNPTLTAPFIGMMIPIAMHYRKWAIAVILALAVTAADSQVATGASIIAVLVYVSSKGWKAAIVCSLALMIGAGIIASNPKIMEPKERFTMWKLIAKDIKDPITPNTDAAFPLTGRGLGSFKYVFHEQHPGTEKEPNRFIQAHNDYLEFAYGCGIAGLFILLRAIYIMLRKGIDVKRYLTGWQDSRKMAIVSSFICVAICAGGTFIWQIGTVAFYSTVLVGLLHNETL